MKDNITIKCNNCICPYNQINGDGDIIQYCSLNTDYEIKDGEKEIKCKYFYQKKDK